MLPSAPLLALLSSFALLALSCERQAPEASAVALPEEYRGIFPPYLINPLPVQAAPRIGPDDKSAALTIYEQVRSTYPAFTDAQFGHQLVERQEDPVRVLRLLELEPGMSVADIGCGSGFYAAGFAHLVGARGKVYALDVLPNATTYLEARLAADPALDPHRNIVVSTNRIDDISLGPGTLDAGLFSHADFYAYASLLPENKAMLASVRRALKPNGRLAVVQFMGFTQFDLVNGENLRANFLSAGFNEELGEYDESADIWYFLFRKPAQP